MEAREFRYRDDDKWNEVRDEMILWVFRVETS